MIENKKVLGLLGLATKAGKVVFGTDACEEAINKKKIRLVIVAEDSAERTKVNFKKLCEKKEVQFIEMFTMDEISKSIGKDNKAIIAIRDANFSKAIIKIINGGDIIG